MTTEVLRNMLYASSDLLENLSYVVMDEVHYLADRFRGAVWEEVIIHLPSTVQVISLSATVSNAEEFGDWLHTVRGHTDVIVSEERPVPLHQHMMFSHKFLPLFAKKDASTVVNPEVVHTAQLLGRGERIDRALAVRHGINDTKTNAIRSIAQMWWNNSTMKAFFPPFSLSFLAKAATRLLPRCCARV